MWKGLGNMEIDRKETAENTKDVVEDISSTMTNASGIVGIIGNVYQVIKKNSNRVIAKKTDDLIQAKVKSQDEQLKAPIQFDIAFRGVDLYIEYPDSMDAQEKERIERDHESFGSRRYVEGFLEQIGVDGLDDIYKLKDNPSYELRDDGFTYTSSMNGCRYNVREYKKELSTSLFEFEGLNVSPKFENLPKYYNKEKLTNKFEVDINAKGENTSLDVGYDDYGSKQNIHEISRFVEIMRRGMNEGTIVEDDVDFVIRTSPRIYDIKDVENSRLTEYKIDANVDTLNTYFEDLESIVQNKDSENKGKVTVLDVVQNSINYIERSASHVVGYGLEDMSNQSNNFKTYDELKQMNLMVDGEIVSYSGDGSHEGNYDRNRQTENTSIYTGMFTEEERRENRARVEARNQENETRNVAKNQKNYEALNAKYAAKKTPDEMRKNLGVRIVSKESPEDPFELG